MCTSGQARIDVKFVRIKEKKIHVKVLQKTGVANVDRIKKGPD